MATSAQPQLSKSTASRLMKEFKELQAGAEGFCVSLETEDHLDKWIAGVFGPPDSCFAGGYYKLRITFPPDYPFSAPKVAFFPETIPYHPNIYPDGNVW